MYQYEIRSCHVKNIFLQILWILTFSWCRWYFFIYRPWIWLGNYRYTGPETGRYFHWWIEAGVTLETELPVVVIAVKETLHFGQVSADGAHKLETSVKLVGPVRLWSATSQQGQKQKEDCKVELLGELHSQNRELVNLCRRTIIHVLQV